MAHTLAPWVQAWFWREFLKGNGPLYLSLHSAPPGASGDFEYVDELYARSYTRWDESGTLQVLADDLRYVTPEGDVVWFGLWTEPAGGRWVGGMDTPRKHTKRGSTYVVEKGTVVLGAV